MPKPWRKVGAELAIQRIRQERSKSMGPWSGVESEREALTRWCQSLSTIFEVSEIYFRGLIEPLKSFK